MAQVHHSQSAFSLLQAEMAFVMRRRTGVKQPSIRSSGHTHTSTCTQLGIRLQLVSLSLAPNLTSKQMAHFGQRLHATFLLLFFFLLYSLPSLWTLAYDASELSFISTSSFSFPFSLAFYFPFMLYWFNSPDKRNSSRRKLYLCHLCLQE